MNKIARNSQFALSHLIGSRGTGRKLALKLHTEAPGCFPESAFASLNIGNVERILTLKPGKIQEKASLSLDLAAQQRDSSLSSLFEDEVTITH